jgi:hypothetical protein
MNHDFKSYEEIKKFFLGACQVHDPCCVILFHNQRQTVHRLLAETAAETGRTLIDQDLSVLPLNEFGCVKFDGTVSSWLSGAMKDVNGKGYIVYLREYHLSPVKIQSDILNALIEKSVEGVPFPKNTLIVLGVRREDENAEGLTHTHIVKFFE